MVPCRSAPLFESRTGLLRVLDFNSLEDYTAWMYIVHRPHGLRPAASVIQAPDRLEHTAYARRSLGNPDGVIKIDILNSTEQLDAFIHRSLEYFSA